jgi:hypothetical protein
MHITALLLAFTTQTTDTIRLEVGSPHVDGRVYQPHAARVRTWIGEGDKKQLKSEWTNVLTHGDSAGKPIHRWVTRGKQVAANGDTIHWELKQTYDARTLAPYGIVRTATNGQASAFRIDGKRVTGTKRANKDAVVEPVDFTVDRLGFVASASDLVPAAVGFKPGLVMLAPVWGPNMPTAEQRAFTVVGKVDIDVEGKHVNAWKVDEHRVVDRKLLATWYLLDTSPYMVAGEVPLPDGTIQRYTEIEITPPPR